MIATLNRITDGLLHLQSEKYSFPQHAHPYEMQMHELGQCLPPSHTFNYGIFPLDGNALNPETIKDSDESEIFQN
jgi:hypothetical protein